MENRKFFKSYELDIEPKSPVHIGSGESYTLRECVDVNGRNIDLFLKRVDLIDYFKKLKDENDQEMFLSELSDENFNLDDFNKEKGLVISSLYNSVNRIYNYKNDKKEKSTHYGNRQIFENTKTLDSVYIPGSSIKGAIRTAIIYNLITEKEIEENLKVSKNFKDFEKLMDGILSEDEENFAKGDILKYMSVSDSDTFRHPTIFKVSNLRFDRTQEKGYKRIRTGPNSFIETIYFEGFVRKSLKSDLIIDYTRGFIDRDSEECLTIERIKEHINNFSKDLINYELGYAKRYGVNYLMDFYQKLLDEYDDEKPLLRLGSGSGLMGTSVVLKVKKFNETLVKADFDVKNFEFFPKSKRIVVTKEHKEAKGYKIANEYIRNNSKIEGLPLGWVQLSFNEND